MARHKILNAFAVPAAGAFTSDPVTIGEAGDLTAVFDFDYGSGGTSLDLWLQTSFDGGTNWYDLIHPTQFTTADAVEIYSVSAAGDLTVAPTEGSKALTAGTVQSGMIGDLVRVAGTVVGTYVASTMTVIVEARQDAGGANVVGLAGADTSEKNAAVSVANTTTALITASAKASRTTLLRNTGDRTVYVGFGASATISMAPLNVGETLKTRFLGAINGITASGTGTVFVLAEAR